MCSEIEKLHQCYSHLQDGLSRRFFEQRLLWMVTGERKYTANMLLLVPEIKYMVDEIRKHEAQKKILFGAGLWSKEVFNLSLYYPEIIWECFCDTYKQGTHCGLPIINFDELKAKYMDACIVLSTGEYDTEITKQCLDAGFSEENIVHAGKAIIDLGKKQYFEEGILLPSQDGKEIFVDAGSCNGGTSVAFIEWANRNYGHVYAFEPNPFMFKDMEENLKKYADITLIPKGLWNTTCNLVFSRNKSNEGGSSILDAGMVTLHDEDQFNVPVAKLDECLSGKPVTFIKMDIEGSEMQALLGAREIITQNHPKLAICIYHKKEDLWEIPNLILSIHSDYKFYLRHYAISENELVLYAI